MKRILRVLTGVGMVVSLTTVTPAAGAAECNGLPTNTDLRGFLQAAAAHTEFPIALGGTACVAGAVSGGGCVGGLFGGARMWGAVVNRDGEPCAFITSTADPTQTWPGSQAIAKAKCSVS